MPVSTKAIKGRIRSVKNTRKITKAMEMVSASKMRRSVEKSQASRDYAELALELLINISKDRVLRHPLLKKEAGYKTLLIVITSNKGLCGSFNINIFKELDKYVTTQLERGRSKDMIKVIAVGKYAERYAKKLDLEVVTSFIGLPDSIEFDEIMGLTKYVIDEFTAGKYDRVRVVYTNYISAISNEVFVRGILPVKPVNVEKVITTIGPVYESKEPSIKSMNLYLFEPGEEEVLNRILPRLTEELIYQTLLESRASEHSARMLAMKNASDSANEMIEELNLYYNKARQASITQEIMEIASGAEALAT